MVLPLRSKTVTQCSNTTNAQRPANGSRDVPTRCDTMQHAEHSTRESHADAETAVRGAMLRLSPMIGTEIAKTVPRPILDRTVT